jgi:chitodextrinase
VLRTRTSAASTGKRSKSVPSAPSNLTATPGNQQVSLSWTASIDRVDGVAGYSVYRNSVKIGQTPSTSYTDSGLTNGTTYSYYAVAYDTSGLASSASNTVSATPTAPTPLGAPSNLTATPGDTQVSLTWIAATGSVTGYRVYRNGVQVGQTTSTSYTDTGLTDGATYSYYVIAYDAAGDLSAPSISVSATPTSSTSTDPSGQPMPVGDISGWHQIFLDNFTVNASLGSFATSNASQVVYTGDHGGQWVEYPDGWPCGSSSPCYEPGQVLSVHDGVLDFYLHNCSTGLPCGANPSPILPTTGTQYQTYGRYDARFKVVYNDSAKLDQYHIAWLLWPQNDANWQYAESDFPEADLNSSNVCAFAHYGGSGAFDHFCVPIDFTQWHTYTQEWGPGYRTYLLDGQVIGTSTNQVFSSPERWQLQTEAHNKGDTTSGHLLVDWVVAYAPS